MRMVQYGGWNGVLDYDGETQLAGVPDRAWFDRNIRMPVPRGCATTCCSMNMAFRTEFTPAMWQLPVLGERFKRFGDIWSGLIQKRILDARGEVMLINGRASVLHERASDPVKNAEIEAAGMPLNEEMWGGAGSGTPPLYVANVDHFSWVTGDMANFFWKRDPEYASHFLSCRDQWLALFQ